MNTTFPPAYLSVLKPLPYIVILHASYVSCHKASQHAGQHASDQSSSRSRPPMWAHTTVEGASQTHTKHPLAPTAPGACRSILEMQPCTVHMSFATLHLPGATSSAAGRRPDAVDADCPDNLHCKQGKHGHQGRLSAAILHSFRFVSVLFLGCVAYQSTAMGSALLFPKMLGVSVRVCQEVHPLKKQVFRRTKTSSVRVYFACRGNIYL